MNIYILLLLCCIIVPYSHIQAQNIPSMTLSSDFRAEVKSLEEFMSRFNGIESKPGIENDKNSRRNNLISLFNFQINKGNASREQFTNRINEFIDSVLVNNVKFRISNAGLLAECVCRMKFIGKEKNLTLILQSEEYKEGRYRWAIVGVRGLNELGLYNTEKYYAISPAEHEIHFMGLDNYLNANPNNAFGYRGHGCKIDPLSVFFTLIRTKEMSFDLVEKQTFYYFDIPGYVITIDEYSRKGTNSGWLISSFDRVSQKEKINRLNKLIGNDKN
ncbi:MAG: hypothetical protein Q4D41_00445 [Prevotellaceae bacterium]|nr:hypothetical protein [Prevotellaceae bacterium]